MGSKPNISSKVYYTKHNKIPLKAYYQEESSHDSDYFILFCSENKKKPSQLLIAANDTLTLTSKKQGFKKLLVKVKEFEPTPHNQNCENEVFTCSKGILYNTINVRDWFHRSSRDSIEAQEVLAELPAAIRLPKQSNRHGMRCSGRHDPAVVQTSGNLLAALVLLAVKKAIQRAGGGPANTFAHLAARAMNSGGNSPPRGVEKNTSSESRLKCPRESHVPSESSIAVSASEAETVAAQSPWAAVRKAQGSQASLADHTKQYLAPWNEGRNAWGA